MSTSLLHARIPNTARSGPARTCLAQIHAASEAWDWDTWPTSRCPFWRLLSYGRRPTCKEERNAVGQFWPLQPPRSGRALRHSAIIAAAQTHGVTADGFQWASAQLKSNELTRLPVIGGGRLRDSTAQAQSQTREGHLCCPHLPPAAQVLAISLLGSLLQRPEQNGTSAWQLISDNSI